jgi:hypothetical protein
MDYERHKEIGYFLKNLNDELSEEWVKATPKSKNPNNSDLRIAIKHLNEVRNRLEEVFYRQCKEQANVNIYYGEEGRKRKD